ncbi:MAG: flagellar basal-body MS-ring/collar protein FliF [Burkholderiaceae bacterium]
MSDSSIPKNFQAFGITFNPKVAMALGTVALAGLIAAGTISLQSPDYRVLFANLGDKDGGSIIANLSKMNIPYRFAAGGNAILVPADQVHAARLKLAADGLPKGANVGFELMDTPRFGMTQFQERLNYQRGLEGELVRTIESLDAVESARVHLAMSRNTGFLRERQKPSASVMVKIRGGHLLDRTQTQGIMHLIASSIPDLDPASVSIVDQEGNLLTPDSQAGGADTGEELRYSRTVEQALSRKITALLEPIVGVGNVRAQVSAEIDFSQSESTDEIFRPNQNGQPASVRSEQRRQDTNPNAVDAQGIPGALTNQPGADAAAPVNGARQQVQGAAAPDAAGNVAPRTLESLVNYEVDKTIRVTRAARRNLKRLSAAVLINHRNQTDEAGTVTQVPLNAQELESINALVREAIGFDANRGDSVNIMNSPFAASAAEPPPVPFWKDPANLPMVLDALKYLALLLLGLFTLNKLIKPALAALTAPPAPALENDSRNRSGTAQIVDQVVENDVELPAQADPQALAMMKQREETLALARQNPTAVAHIVRGWVANEG